MSQKLNIDHLAVVAPSLQQGEDYVRCALGVDLQPGGAHPRMGTHNKLLKLGPALYLEVIAIDPLAERPSRPRWFALDDLSDGAEPRLATWVARTDDIDATVQSSPLDHGCVEPMSRGDLHWQITVAEDGSLAAGGTEPPLIMWPGAHPASSMAASGCSLNCLELYCPTDSALDDFLRACDFEGPVLVHRLAAGQTPFIRALIDTPQGLRRLGPALAGES